MFTRTERKDHPFVIDNHVPIPSDEDLPFRTESRYAFLKTMKVGESFLADSSADGYKLTTLIQSTYELKKKTGYQFSYRTMSGSIKKPTSWIIRLWRVK